jgi:hypothetical protein
VLPASVIYGSAISTLGSCSRSGQTVTCTIGALGVSNSATITIVGTNNLPGTITNVANLYATVSDPNGANNTATLVSTVSLPMLSVNRMGTNVILAWPSAATGFQLQSLTNLTLANWSLVTNVPVITNNQFSVTRPLQTNNQHFRLRRP